MSATVERRRFTVAEFGRLVEVGVFRADERLELVEGEVVEMSPIGGRHAACVDLLTRSVSRLAGDLAIVRVQGPLAVPDDSELSPDVALLKPRDDFYRSRKPTGADALLVVEVSDTTPAYDRDVKAPIYGRGGVPEFWLVDLGSRRIARSNQGVRGDSHRAAQVHQLPRASGDGRALRSRHRSVRRNEHHRPSGRA